MKLPNFEAFRNETTAQGFDEVIERVWAPSAVVQEHRHPFAVRALVVKGEMWLKVGDDERHLVPGDEFRLERDAPHEERYGEQGATLWAARRHGQ